MTPPLRRVSIQGYRAARELELTPGSVCAFVGEASSGKSTVLTAIWTLLEAAAPPPTIDDVARDGAGGRIRLEADVAKGTIFLDAKPPDTLNLNRKGAPPVLFLPANLRSRTLVAPATGRGAAEVVELFQPPLVDHHWAAADGGLALVAGMERLLVSHLRHFVLLIEEPELYLSPHAQRHLYSLLRELAQAGNQILYSTHAPVFLSVDKLEELALIRQTPTGGTSLFQPEPLAEAESGGKGNMPLFARIANACSVPYVVVHDRDAPRGMRPVESERIVNSQIREVAGSRRTVVLTPDFESVSGLRASTRGRKPQKAWQRYRGNGEVPEPLRVAVEKVLKIAQSG